MIRRWCMSLVTTALVFGSLLAAAGPVSAAAAHPAASHVTPASWIRGFRPGGVMRHPAGPAARAHGGASTVAQSTNWSGYAAAVSAGSFHGITASWTEPKATCRGRGSKYSSFWVGLDGYNSSSVEQTGTDADCSGSTPVYYGWYEMYPAYPVNFRNPVRPGDSITASVTFSGTRTYTLVLKDVSRGWTQTVTKNQGGLPRSSAEVITEAPSSSSGVLPLANFGKVSYSSSTADGSSLAAQSPTEIVMIDNSGADKDATSSIGSGGAFSNTWIRSN